MKTIEIFWSPALFSNEDEQWNLLYSEPKPVVTTLQVNKDTKLIKCPAVKQRTKNLFRVDSQIQDIHKFEKNYLTQITSMPDDFRFTGSGLVALRKTRASSIPNYINVSYNLSWLFFSYEPLMAKFTAPYYPAKSPSTNALLATGEFDIGQWFRPFNLDYHLPLNTQEFSFEKNDPIFFLELMTDAKITFRRFIPTLEILQLATEMSRQADRLPRLSLAERYQMAKNSGVINLVKKAIEKAVI